MKIADVLTGPEKWTKEYAARDAIDNPINAADPKAVKFCLLGAVCRAYPEAERWEVRRKIFDVLDRSLHNISDFNDAPERTFAEVLELCEKAGV